MANEKRRAIIAATLKKFYREPDFQTDPLVQVEKITPPPGLAIIREERPPMGTSPLSEIAKGLNKKASSPFGPPPGFELPSFETPPPLNGNPFGPQPVLPMPSHGLEAFENDYGKEWLLCRFVYGVPPKKFEKN